MRASTTLKWFIDTIKISGRIILDSSDMESLSEALANSEELELFKSEHLRLEAELNAILHPNGDGPANPSFCDLVAYVRSDLKVMQRGGYLPEGLSINQVVGELHHERVLPKAMWAQIEPLEVTPETVEKLKDELSKLRVLPRGLTPIVEPSCDWLDGVLAQCGYEIPQDKFRVFPNFCPNCGGKVKVDL